MNPATDMTNTTINSNSAADFDIPVPYLKRSRDFYRAMGYSKDYVWSHLQEVPFTPIARPLNQSTIALITTARPITAGKGAQGPGTAINRKAAFFEVYFAATDPPPELGISHLHYDRKHTDAADQGAIMPFAALAAAVADGRIGAVAPRFHGVPTRYSQRLTLARDGPDVLARLREDKVDTAILPAI